MIVYNKSKTKVLENYDLKKGYLKEDIITIHHDAIKGQEEKGHYETIATYENGGKDVKYIIDQPQINACDEYDEKIEIKVYIPYTNAELTKLEKIQRLNELKALLHELDSYTFAYLDKFITSEEYEQYRIIRNSYREEIAQIEKEI